jgi:S13-like H2TH domain
MPLQPLTPEQRAAALEKAAASRKARSEALARLRNGNVTIAQVLADLDSPLQKARVRQVLLAVPGVGAVTADKVMAEVQIDPKRRVAGLGARQREALAGHFA